MVLVLEISLFSTWRFWVSGDGGLFTFEKESLWKQVIIEKYGEDKGGWSSRMPKERLWCCLFGGYKKKLGGF